MAADRDCGAEIAARVAQACAGRHALAIRGGGTRVFPGRPELGERLDVAAHRGVVAWEPSELVLTARAGTPLAEVEALLASGGQMLGFEPPRCAPASTLGGAIASAMSGPRRPYAGAARDFVLGVRCVNDYMRDDARKFSADGFEQLTALIKDSRTGAHLDSDYIKHRLFTTIDVVLFYHQRKLREIYYDPEHKRKLLG